MHHLQLGDNEQAADYWAVAEVRRWKISFVLFFVQASPFKHMLFH